MAKGRMIDKVVILSRKINKISEGAENLYYRIYVNTDDFGRYHADPDIIKGQIYTLRKISLETIQHRIAELAKIELINLYNNNNEEYLEIVDFEKHQKFRKDIIRRQEYPIPVTYLKRDVTDRYESVTEGKENSLNQEQQKVADKSVTDSLQHVTKRCSKLSKDKLNKDNAHYFNEFWKEYPRKISKDYAKQVWKRLNPDQDLIDKILRALKKVKQSEAWKDVQFVPYPSTWINGKRWNDEINSQVVLYQDDKPEYKHHEVDNRSDKQQHEDMMKFKEFSKGLGDKLKTVD